MNGPGLQWSGTRAPDDEITPNRRHALDLLPLDMLDLEKHFEAREATEVRDWLVRTKRAKWHPGLQKYVAKGRR